jgi:hypothetical protein
MSRNALTYLVDVLGLKWSEPKRQGGTRAFVSGEPGDTIRQLAWIIKLDPEEYLKWLQHVNPSNKSSLPDSADAPLKGRCEFSVPNTAVITYGDLTPNPTYPQSVEAGTLQEMSRVEQEFTKAGYLVLNNNYDGQKGNGLDTINRRLSLRDIAIWAHGGHGNEDGLLIHNQGGEQRVTSKDIKLHHKLSRIILYVCRQGGKVRVADWQTLIAPGGTLNALAINVRAADILQGPMSWRMLDDFIVPGTSPFPTSPSPSINLGWQAAAPWF